METAKIRQAGYPIRYSYAEFVHRYRLIVSDIPPAEKTDCKNATKKICTEILKDQEFRLGHTKVFLKNGHDVILEELRHEVLMKAVVRVQANARRFIHRKRFLRMRDAAITIQKHFRARGYRNRYLTMRRGYLRLQAVIRSRELKKTFSNIRLFFRKFQGHCRGHLVRRITKEKGHIIKTKLQQFKKEKEELLKSGKTDVNSAENDYEKKFRELMRSIWIIKDVPVQNNVQNAAVIDDKYLDDVFGFLKEAPTSTDTESGTGFGVVSHSSDNFKFVYILYVTLIYLHDFIDINKEAAGIHRNTSSTRTR